MSNKFEEKIKLNKCDMKERKKERNKQTNKQTLGELICHLLGNGKGPQYKSNGGGRRGPVELFVFRMASRVKGLNPRASNFFCKEQCEASKECNVKQSEVKNKECPNPKSKKSQIPIKSKSRSRLS